MNLYSIHLDGDEEWYNNELIDVVHHVAATTRGKAKGLLLGFLDGFNQSFDWTDRMTIHKIASDVDMPEGVDEDYAWAQANVPGFKLIEF